MGKGWTCSPIYLIGPKKGQPKLCKLCPSLIYIPAYRKGSPERLCRAHYLAHKNRSTFIAKRNSPERLARVIRALTPTKKDTVGLAGLKQRTFNGDGNYFDHLDPRTREIAEHELHIQMLRKPNYTPLQLPQMVARALAYASCGGKKHFDARGRRMVSARRYWRNMIANHPEDLPAGFDISMIPPPHA